MKIIRMVGLLIIGVAIVATILFGYYRFNQSSIYIQLGDIQINAGNVDEAIALYEKARDLFPFRPGISKNLDAAGLINQETTRYGQEYKIPTDISQVPTIPAITPSSMPLQMVKVPILMYHHIRVNPRPKDPLWASLNVLPSQLEEQLQYLTSHNFHVVTLDDILSALDATTVLPDNPIVLSFDDGYRNFFENAYPLIKKYNVRAINFVITGVVGTGAYLTWSQIHEMDKSGLVLFGDHTKHHPVLPILSQSLIKDEITGSKKDLERELKKPIKWFAYPYGSYNNTVVQMVKDAGFVGALSVIPGVSQSKETLFLTPRITIDGRYTISDFIKRVTQTK